MKAAIAPMEMRSRRTIFIGSPLYSGVPDTGLGRMLWAL
jgi:hypothetical protein